MKTRLSIMLVFLILAGIGFSSQSLNAQNYSIRNWVIAGGGTISAQVGNGMKMHSTIGQYAAGQYSQGGNTLYVGFWGPTTESMTSVDDNTPSVSGMSTISNYPNPFSMMTTINYTVPQSSVLTMRVIDLVGREVRMLINNEYFESGNHFVQWDAKDDSGADVGAGNYVCEMSLTINGEVLKARVPMMLVK
ncbi:MAG: hypothetical protein FJ219_06535 [Ignavibacteria bacterium]|nr:hypothetical protein [Ignavibacteria bacterium]